MRYKFFEILGDKTQLEGTGFGQEVGMVVGEREGGAKFSKPWGSLEPGEKKNLYTDAHFPGP